MAERLEVPSAMISTIRVITTHQHSGDTALYKVVEWWFANNPNPEWAAVNKVIEEFERGRCVSVSPMIIVTSWTCANCTTVPPLNTTLRALEQ